MVHTKKFPSVPLDFKQSLPLNQVGLPHLQSYVFAVLRPLFPYSCEARPKRIFQAFLLGIRLVINMCNRLLVKHSHFVLTILLRVEVPQFSFYLSFLALGVGGPAIYFPFFEILSF